MKKYILLISILFSSSAIAEEYCREYNTVITIDGKPQQAYGISCLQPDGSWALQNNSLTLKNNPSLSFQPKQRIEVVRPVIVPYYSSSYIYRTYPNGYFYYGHEPFDFNIRIGNRPCRMPYCRRPYRPRPHYKHPHHRKPYHRHR